jgi:hypothetical protein
MTTRRKSTGAGFSSSVPQKETVESLETIVEKEPVVEVEPEEIKVVAVAEPAPVVYAEVTPVSKPHNPEPKRLRHPRNIARFSNK